MTSSPARRQRRVRARRGRPKGSTVPFARDRQRFTIAALWGYRLAGAGAYTAAYWASITTSDEPIRPQDIGGLMTVAGTRIKHSSVTPKAHFEHLARKADRIPPDSDAWLETSATTIKALILAARNGNLEIYCAMLDLLMALGWRDVIERLTSRIDDALASNIPPFDGQLGRAGRKLLTQLRTSSKKSQ
jgi:hypothetical protein